MANRNNSMTRPSAEILAMQSEIAELRAEVEFTIAELKKTLQQLQDLQTPCDPVTPMKPN